ncbi:MAG: LysM peptidoglycan-binding domain-containing protein [Chloroflexi bacterium]|nr:LysM peptidoglycan-binding domain-containing protein [Chloroflexota bacterium]
MKRMLLALIVLSSLILPAVTAEGQSSNIYVHTVGAGQTLTSVAALYNISVSTLREVNKLSTDTLYIGQKLLIPLGRPLTVHTVSRGENLYSIARRYGIPLQSIVWANNLSNTNLIYVGQKLVIPPTKNSTQATPSPKPTATAPVVQEAIIITSPILNNKITSPLTITGWGAGYENTLAVAVLDEEGKTIGKGTVTISAEFGQYGPFTGTVTFTMPQKAQVGKIQVFSLSPRDGSIEHLNSVMIKFQP